MEREVGWLALLELEWILMEMGAIKGPQRLTVWLKFRVDKKKVCKEKAVPKQPGRTVDEDLGGISRNQSQTIKLNLMALEIPLMRN